MPTKFRHDEAETRFINVEEGLGGGLDVAQLKILLIGVGAGIVAACAVNEDVALAKSGQHCIMGGLDALRVGDVAAKSHSLAALLADFFRQCLALGEGTVQNSDLCPALGEGADKLTAQYACAARHNGDLATQVGFQSKIHSDLL